MSIDRRSFLRLGSIISATSAINLLQTPQDLVYNEPKPPIVLVHGGWHGSWCWKYVAAKLRATGHDVYTPTLSGLGERVHLAGTGVNLDMHILDVMNVLEAEELSNVVLVGHSYAGMVIAGVADRAGKRLHGLVYLDAFVPDNGSRMLDYLPTERRNAMVKAGESGGYVDPLPVRVLGITNATDQEWVARRMTRQPYGTFTQQLKFENDGGKHLPRTYVYCSNPPTGSFDQFATRFRTDPAWKFYELKTGHDCMITMPDDVAQIVLSAAK